MKWLSMAFFLILVAIIVAADRGRLPQSLRSIYAFPGGDKVGHFVLMGIFSFLVNMALPLRPAHKPWRSLWIGTVVILVAVTLEEASQGLFRTRTLSWADLGSSYAGILSFGYGAWILRTRKQSRVG
jgi:polysaccharide biosynthesis protein VpsQ